MPNFDDMMNDSRLSRLIAAGRKAGTYKLTQNKKGQTGMHFMGDFYTDPTQLGRVAARLDVKTQTHRITGDALSSMPQNLGQYYYGNLEAAVRKVRTQTPWTDFEMRRTSFGLGVDIEELQKQRIRKGTEYGFMVPDDKGFVLVQGYRGGKEVTSAEMRGLFQNMGIRDISNIHAKTGKLASGQITAAQFDASYAKLSKRMKLMINAERYSTDVGPLKAHIFGINEGASGRIAGQGDDYSRITAKFSDALRAGTTGKEAASVFDGMNAINPTLVTKIQGGMESRLAELEAGLAGPEGKKMSPYLRQQAESSIRSLKSDIKDLANLAKNGGRVQDFRASNFDEAHMVDVVAAHIRKNMPANPKAAKDEATKIVNQLMASMAKGDAYVPKSWSGFANRLGSALGYSKAEIASVMGSDFVAPHASIVEELATDTGVTLKMTKTKGSVRIDEQTVAAFGRPLFGTDTAEPFKDFSEANLKNFKTAIDRLRSGEIPPGYIDALHEIINSSTDDPMKIPELVAQQGRARRIIKSLDMGLDPSTDRGLFKEISQGFLDSMQREKFGPKSSQISGQIQGSFSGHIMSDAWAGLFGIREGKDLARGTFGFSAKAGMIYNSQDLVDYVLEAHGGADFDDLVGSILHSQGSNLFAFNKRSPIGAGEAVVMKLDAKSLETVARVMTDDASTTLPQNLGMRAALDDIGFYDKNWNDVRSGKQGELLSAITDNVTKMNQAERTALEQLAYAHRGTGPTSTFTPPTYHGPTEIMDRTKNYRGYLDSARDEMAYIGIPDIKQAHEMFDDATWKSLGVESQQEWKQLIERKQVRGALGKHELAREMANEMSATAHAKGIKGVENMIHPFEMEPILDLLTKGTAGDYDVAFRDIEVMTEALYRQMAQVAQMGAMQGKHVLDPSRLDIDGRNYLANENLQAHFKALGGGDISEYLMAADDPLAQASQARVAQARRHAEAARYMDQNVADIAGDPIFSRTVFDNKAIEDSDILRDAYLQARRQAEAGRTGLPNNMQQMDMFGHKVIDVENEAFYHRYGTEEVQRTLAGMFEKDAAGEMVMGRRAMNAVGAFMQREQRTGASRILGSGQLADAVTKAHATLGMEQGRIPIVSQHQATSIDKARDQVITHDYMMGKSDDIPMGLGDRVTKAGTKRAGLTGAAYDKAQELLGKNSGSLMDLGKKLWGEGIVRKGVFGAGALVGASLLYRATKDRTVDDLAGPPLLPGGSFYENTPSPDMPVAMGPNSNQQDSGYSYRINARGDFDPGTLAAAAGPIAGARAHGSVFKSLAMKLPNPLLELGAF